MRRDLDSTWTLAMGHLIAYEDSKDHRNINIDGDIFEMAHACLIAHEWGKYPGSYERIRGTAWHNTRKNALMISIESLLNERGSQECLLSIRESKAHSTTQ
jgi:hypothetical protein